MIHVPTMRDLPILRLCSGVAAAVERGCREGAVTAGAKGPHQSLLCSVTVLVCVALIVHSSHQALTPEA